MKKMISSLIEQAQRELIDPTLQEYGKNAGLYDANESWEDARDRVAEEVTASREYVRSLLEGRAGVPAISISEAAASSDASIIFRREINTVLQEAVEPVLFLSNQVAEVIQLPWNAPKLIEFANISAVRAGDVSEGMDYPTAQASFGNNTVSIQIGKVGVQMGLPEEMIRSSQWNLLGIYARTAANAVNRFVEAKLYNLFKNKANAVFDNNSASSTFRTTGGTVVSGATSANGSISYYDLVKMAGVVIGNKYTPTHLLSHPLGWPIFMNDPYLRANFFHGGSFGNAWGQSANFDQQSNMPFGITYVPYYAVDYTESATLSNWSGLGTIPLVTDIYMIDKNNSLFLANRGGSEMDSWEDFHRDQSVLKCRRFVGVSLKDAGRGVAVARNVCVVRNEEALFTVKQVTS